MSIDIDELRRKITVVDRKGNKYLFALEKILKENKETLRITIHPAT